MEVLRIGRLESQRIKMRKTSQKENDVAIALPPGSKLRDYDVLMLKDDYMIVVEIEPEHAAVVKAQSNPDYMFELSAVIGHTIGNLKADTELNLLIKQFSSISQHVKVRKARMVFDPEETMEVHKHEH